MLYFASAATFTKKDSEYLPAPLPTSKLFGVLEARYPGFERKVLSSCAVTINMNYVDVKEGNDTDVVGQKGDDSLIINVGDEVAIIPPVSSG
ncbi:hypothetical protein MMC09_002556 [Bachmanniomyces sp. S44760]|nr:hypothetical protein [Bachmanniomyces sp. S44760]